MSSSDRALFAAIAADRNSVQKDVWRALIILMTADGLGTAEIIRGTGKSKPSVWRWQERFMQTGVDGLLRDKTRSSRILALAQVVERIRADPPGEATHWTVTAMAKEVGISISSVQRIWRAHKLQPHRIRTFKLSRDAQFVAKNKALLEGASELFERSSSTKEPVVDEAKVKALHAKIGELTVADGTMNMRDAPGITVSPQLVRKAQTVDRQVRRSMVERDRTDLPVVRQCQLLSISRSSFYATPHGESESDSNLTIMAEIDRQFQGTPFYGFRQWRSGKPIYVLGLHAEARRCRYPYLDGR